jgi:hypothetical protein
MTSHKIANPAEVTPENIIRPSSDELLEDQRQGFEAIKAQHRARPTCFVRSTKKTIKAWKKEEDQKTSLASFAKDHQGAITSTDEVGLTHLWWMATL